MSELFFQTQPHHTHMSDLCPNPNHTTHMSGLCPKPNHYSYEWITPYKVKITSKIKHREKPPLDRVTKLI